MKTKRHYVWLVVVFYMLIVDFTFDIEIHIREYFVEDPTLRYVGGSVHTLTEIDPDKLSFFEIRDLCHLVGASKEHSRYRCGEPLAVEHPDGGGVANDGVGGDGGVDSLGHEQERGPRQGDEEEGNEIGNNKGSRGGASVKALDEFVRMILAKMTLEFHNHKK
ncbi:hypothetical protein CFP56_027898 [Quercus suber]|uniref:PB1-like domain-containing protein n=1 Tax=Quercus suber TaxID=58331 RepID=A0AAW0JX33_QUESU